MYINYPRTLINIIIIEYAFKLIMGTSIVFKTYRYRWCLCSVAVLYIFKLHTPSKIRSTNFLKQGLNMISSNIK